MPIKSKVFPASARKQLHSSRAYLSVSLSNRLSETETRLKAVLQWMQRNVSRFDVVIGDYFHRHNIEDLEGCSVSEALEIAIEQGKTHACRIQLVLDQLGLAAVKIRPAADLSRYPGFAPALSEMESAWRSDGDFAQLIDEGTDAFLRRLAPKRISIESARLHSRLYQLEELALFTVLANEGYSANVYAGAHLPVMKELVNGELGDVTPALRNMRLVELYPRPEN